LPAGVLHAYLEGSGVEIMANSNNVLRGGLTSKHVDVAELLEVIEFEAKPAETVHAARCAGAHEWRYATPAREFELRRIEVGSQTPFAGCPGPSAEILILVAAEGPVEASEGCGRPALPLCRGEVLLAPCGQSFTLQSSRPATFYKASVPPDA
jgi:mannose-6-phosphate isomerase class I